ncbi:pectate lyase [Streptomyces capparidis]
MPVTLGAGAALGTGGTARAVDRGAVVRAMVRAAEFMDEEVSYRGGYVWNYLPDLSARWGEMRARRTMCWVQPPGTPSVGHGLLDAYHATGEERLYRAAERTGLALVAAQHPSGGWNYVHDFAGEDALREWYATVGANGWRLEEFQHHYGNATFDDATTSTAGQLLLRLYLERGDRRFGRALGRAVGFVLRSQLRGGTADGGWPQRYPAVRGVDAMPWPDHVPSWVPADARPAMEDGDYTSQVTFNDDVLGENVKFLLMCAVGLGRRELTGPVRRAMECLRRQQRPGPQAGWGAQHLARPRGGRPAGAPASARSYEPRALAPAVTQTNVRQLFHYFRLTGDRAFLRRVPEALAWLETCRLTPRQIEENPLLAGRTHPTHVELGSNRARFVHRFGSNVRNGAYYWDHDHRHTLKHSPAAKNLNPAALWATYEELAAMPDAEVAAMVERSPMSPRGGALPRWFSVRRPELTDLFAGAPSPLPAVGADEAARLVAELGDRGHWRSAIPVTTNPCAGPGTDEPYDGRAFMSTDVGDVHDTSPYDPRTPPQEPPYTPAERAEGITTETFTANLARLTAHVAGA